MAQVLEHSPRKLKVLSLILSTVERRKGRKGRKKKELMVLGLRDKSGSGPRQNQSTGTHHVTLPILYSALILASLWKSGKKHSVFQLTV
jgi:hypothetical protein